MATTISITRARIVNGQVEIVFNNGQGYLYPSIADFTAAQDQAVFADIDLMQRIALALIANRAPNLSNPAAIEGKSLTFNPDIANVLRVT